MTCELAQYFEMTAHLDNEEPSRVSRLAVVDGASLGKNVNIGTRINDVIAHRPGQSERTNTDRARWPNETAGNWYLIRHDAWHLV